MTNHTHNHKYNNSSNSSNNNNSNNNNSNNNNYHKKLFKKHIRAVFVILALLGLFYFSIPMAMKLTGFTISEQASNTALITVNPNEETGVIRNDFYGVNIQRYASDIFTLKISPNYRGTFDTYTNLTWHENEWQKVGFGEFRESLMLSHFYSNTSDSSGVNMTGNMTKLIKEVELVARNDKKMLISIYRTPKFLANITALCADDISSCPPTNYTIWENIILDSLNRLTSNGLYASNLEIEVWNEPYSNLFLYNLPDDDPQKSYFYNQIYNSTYRIIKSVYPSILVGGPAGFRHAPNMMNSFLSNFSQEMDFVSLHPYVNGAGFYLGSNVLYTDIKNLFNLCYEYDANCSRVIASEWNIFDSDLMSNPIRSNEYEANIAYAYVSILNSYPENSSLQLFQWSESYYYNDTLNYPEYPLLFSMVSEPQLDNAYYAPYNVTKNFAHYHAGGDMILNSSSDNSNIKVVSSVKSNGTYYITVISTSTTDVDTSIDLSLTNIAALQNIETGVIYPVTGGFANVGTLSQYDVKYFVSTSVPAGDTIAPTITVISPTSQIYTANSVSVNISLNEQGSCTYTLNSGTQKSMTTTNNLLFKANENSLANGNYNLETSCIDLSGNGDSATVSFTINVSATSNPSPSSAGGSASSGGGGGGGGGGAATNQIVSSNTNNTSVPNADVGLTNEANNNGGSGVTDNNSSDSDKQFNQTIKSGRGILGAAITDLSSITKSGWGIAIIGLITAIVIVLIIIVAYKSALKKAEKKATNEGLKEWIQKAKAMGHNDKNIHKMLTSHGWDARAVHKAIKDVGDRPL